MAFSAKAKLLLGAVSASGGCCAVAVPASLSSGGRISSPLISKCEQKDPNSTESVTFGDKVVENVCWKLKDEDSDQEESSTQADNSSENQLTSFLQEIWANRENLSRKEELSVGWKSNCSEGKWKLSSTSISGGGSEKVWGYCRGKASGESLFPFVEFTDGDSNPEQFRVCFQGTKCWTDSFGGEGISTLTNKDRGEWKTLEFQKK